MLNKINIIFEFASNIGSGVQIWIMSISHLNIFYMPFQSAQCWHLIIIVLCNIYKRMVFLQYGAVSISALLHHVTSGPLDFNPAA